LTQDHKLYPLTLADNIGLGAPEHANNLDMIADSARDGRAAAQLHKFKDRIQTTSKPNTTALGHQLDDDAHKSFKRVLGKL
ncbi:hypothetical protein B0H13DRAFT_1636905, partial [Mycena leptocephala]